MRDDRIWVKDGRRHFRRTYAVGEVKAGVVVIAVLAGLTAWVVWKGGRPEPGLYEAAAEAGAPRTTPVVAVPASAPPSPTGSPMAPGGPLPPGLAPAGWQQGPPSTFDGENLYVKINGRADYYKSFGFVRLDTLTLTSDADASRTVDVELFDQGQAANALGAYDGERQPNVEPELDAAGLAHLDRNALFMTRGRYYVRVIGSEEGPAMTSVLTELRQKLTAALPSEPLPWAYALFAGGLGLKPGSISFQPENALSFDFARNVYSATLADGETDLFVTRAADDKTARELAARFVAGFRGYGEDAASERGLVWIKDRYLASFATAVADGAWVAGVRGAPKPEAGSQALARLRAALARLPAEVAARPATGESAGAGDAYPGDGASSAAAQPESAR